MNNLNLKLKGGKLKDLHIEIDEKPVKFKKNKFGGLESSFETERDVVKIKMFKCLEIQSKMWFLWQMLFFFLGIFGIFDRRIDRKCVVLDAELSVKVNENTSVEFAFDYTSKGKILKYNTEAEVDEIKNISYVDLQAKKRLKALRLTKIFTTIAVAIVAVLLVVLI